MKEREVSYKCARKIEREQTEKKKEFKTVRKVETMRAMRHVEEWEQGHASRLPNPGSTRGNICAGIGRDSCWRLWESIDMW